MRLSETDFYRELSDELQQAKALSEQKRFGDIAGMAGTMSGVAEGLAGIARGLDSAVIRLSEHGHAGGQELNTLLGGYRRQLNQLKAQVKTRVTGITGASLANFSRGGMLARGVAEWAEELKQAWLAGLAPAQREEATAQFDRALMAVLAENRAHLAGQHDPQAEGFLKRLMLARQHAATGTQVYPPTAEEILAGSRSVPEDVRRWAERKVLSGALWGALRGGFNLVTGPVSLPVRVAIRGARTGYTLASGLRKMNRVRLGEPPATGARRQFINQALAKIGIRLTLSLSPAVGWSVAVIITAGEAARNRHDKKALKKMVKRFALNIPEEGLWAGGYAGVNAAVREVIRVRSEQAIREGLEKMVADARARAMSIFGEEDLESYLVSSLSPEDLGEHQIVATEFDEVEPQAEAGAVAGEAQTAATLSEETDEAEIVSVEESIEGTLQLADEVAEAVQAVSAEPPPAAPRRRTAALKRPGIKSLTGRATPGVALTSPSSAENKETTLAEVSEGGSDDTAAKSRNKRAANDGFNPNGPIRWPTPNRDSAIDPALDQKVRELFPVNNGIPLTASKTTLVSERLKYYRNNGENFLFVGGRYRLLHNIVEKSNGSYEAEITPYWDNPGSSNVSLKIKFNPKDAKWHLREESSATNIITPNKNYIITRSSNALKQAALYWPGKISYKFSHMEPGQEGQTYYEYNGKYIFLNNHYWPITLLSEQKAIVKGAHEGKDVTIELRNNEWQLISDDTSEIVAKQSEKLLSLNSTGNTSIWTPTSSSDTTSANWPVPVRKNAIDHLLEQRIIDIFPANSGFRKPAADLKLKYPQQGVYAARDKQWEIYYLYIGGYYRYIRLTDTRPGGLKGVLFPKREGESKSNPGIAISFNYAKDCWRLDNETGQGSGDNIPATTSKANMTQATQDLVDEAANWSSSYAYTYNDMVSGEQGAIYDDGIQKSIYLNNHYWKITFTSSTTATIQNADNGRNIDLQLVNNTWSKYDAVVKKTFIDQSIIDTFDDTTATSDLFEQSAKWDEASLSSGSTSNADSSVNVYKGADNGYYISIKGMNLPFKYIHKGTGAIFVNENGANRAIIVQRYNGKLYSIGKIDGSSFDEFRRLITSMEFDNDIITRISDLFNPTNVPQENFLNELNTIMNTQFNRTYTQPTDTRNQLVLRMKAIISAYLYKSVIENQYLGNTWDPALLYSYQYALQIDAIEPQDITRAQFARTSVAEMFNKIELLRTDEIEKSIYNVDVQVNNKEIEKAWRKQELDDANLHEVQRVIFLENEIKDIQNQIEQLKKQRSSLVELRKSIIEKKIQYNRDISLLIEKYTPYWKSKDLAKEIYEEELNKHGQKRDHISAAENALVRLVLQEINITYNKIGEYTESELDNLKTIRAARTDIRGMLLRQHAFDDILRKLKDSDVNKPVSKKDFNDILWANRQAEKLDEQYFAGDEHNEARKQLPAVLYWLLVKGKDVSALRDQDIDKITDEYYTDLHRLNPLTDVKSIPAGYRPLSSMMSSLAFASYSDYAAQFNEYINKHSSYEASEVSKQLLALSGLSIEDMLKPVQRRVRLRISQGRQTGATPLNCELVFMQLDDGRWIFFSIFPSSTFCKIISNDDMQKNSYLKYISETTNSRYRPETEDIQFNFGKNIMFEDQRWKDAVNGLTKSILYEGEQIPDVFKDGAIHQLYYNKADNNSFSGNVISALNVSMRAVLQRSARANKIEMFTPSALQKAAFALIPYYQEIYHATNDPQYEPDVASIVVDTVGVVLVAAQAGVQIGTIIRNISTVGKLTQQGLRAGLSGKSLQLYIIRHMAEEAAFASLKVLKTTATSLIDLVDPISLRDMPSLVRNVGRKTDSLLNIIPKATSEATSRGINNKYIITGMTLDDMHQQTLHGATVYSPSSVQGGDKKYYIKQDGNIYQVRWDEAYHTWRTVDQNNPGRFSYGEPIVYENSRWQINKNYGGLRGGARDSAESRKKDHLTAAKKESGNSKKVIETTDEDDVIAFGSQPIRQGLPDGIPTQSLWNDVLFKGENMLAELKKKADIREAIKEPAEKCEFITHTVASYMIENGFTNIRYRGMAIFANGGDEGAINHFVVVGTRRRRDYVFDISAGQFAKYYPDLNGPQILPEEVWAQKYANVSNRALMKYGDYKTQEKASYYFGPYSKWLSYGPNTRIPGATVLKARSWYFPGQLLAKSTQPGFTMLDMPVPEHPIRTAYRNSRVTTGESGVCWDYAVGLIEDAKVIETGTANNLRNGLKLAAQYNNSASSTGGGLDGLFASTRVINEKTDLTRMKPGELLLFMEVDPNNASKGARPVHCVVSLGNGRFAGTKNSILDTSLGDHKRLLNVRQFGEFNNGILTRYGNKTQPPLQLIAGIPHDMAKLNVPIHKLAEMFVQPATGKADIAKGTTKLLAMAEELSPEQAHEVYVRLKTMFATSSDQQRATLKHIFTSWTKIKDQAQLGALPKGQLIVFEPNSIKGPLKHVMYSLGDKKFLMIDPQRLDTKLVSKTGVIHASMFNNSFFKQYNISSGVLDVTKLSNLFLLRWGAVVVFSSSIVGVGLREVMTGKDTKRPADPEELSNDIIESILSKKSDFFSIDIKTMKVSSTFGSYGSYPPEKALAYFTKKQVITYPWVFSSVLRDNWAREALRKFYEPTDFNYPDDLKKTAEQEQRNIALWDRFKQGYTDDFSRPTPPGEFEKLLRAIMDVAHDKKSVKAFLQEFPAYKKGLYVSESVLNEVVDDKVEHIEHFAERCWDLLLMSSYSADVNNGLLTKYLSA